MRTRSGTTTVAVGAILLTAVLILVNPLLNWLAVNDAFDAASAANPAHEQYFIDAWVSGARLGVVIILALNLAIVVGLLLLAFRVWRGRRPGVGWGIFIVVAVCGGAGLTLNPVLANVSGDPDGESLVERHLPDWFQNAITIHLVAVGVAALVAVLALALATRRQSTPKGVSASDGA